MTFSLLYSLSLSYMHAYNDFVEAFSLCVYVYEYMFIYVYLDVYMCEC